MKYIIVAEGSSEYAILFDEILTHASVAGNLRVKSAGFCLLDLHSVREQTEESSLHIDVHVAPSVYGYSASLGLKVREEDADLVGQALRRRI